MRSVRQVSIWEGGREFEFGTTLKYVGGSERFNETYFMTLFCIFFIMLLCGIIKNLQNSSMKLVCMAE